MYLSHFLFLVELGLVNYINYIIIYYNQHKLTAKYLPHFKSDLLYERSNPDENIALSIGRFTDVKQQILLLQIWNSLINSG